MRILFLVLAFLCLKLTHAHAIEEARCREAFRSQLKPFLATVGKKFQFEGEGGLRLAAIRFVHPASQPATRGTIVVLPGRSEPFLKYVEVFYDLYHRGYDLYSYDHRGQGLSPHLSPHDPQIGHIDHFENYVRDLRVFTDTQVQPNVPGPVYLLAHSMGGGIAARYLGESEGHTLYRRVVLSAPMLDIQTNPYPRPLARAIVTSAVRMGLGNHYAPGYGDYEYDIPIEKNHVTHSENRAWMYDQITRENPRTAIGGPSSAWVREVLSETRLIQNGLPGITVPTLMLQAGQDTYVDNTVMNAACEKIRDCRIEHFPDARHEILQEKDATRDAAIQHVDDFFQTGR